MFICCHSFVLFSVKVNPTINYGVGLGYLHIFPGATCELWCTLQEKNLDWFPRMRAMSLAADDGEGEQNELRNLQQQLESTNKLVQTLSSQLAELKEQVSLPYLTHCALEMS